MRYIKNNLVTVVEQWLGNNRCHILEDTSSLFERPYRKKNGITSHRIFDYTISNVVFSGKRKTLKLSFHTAYSNPTGVYGVHLYDHFPTTDLDFAMKVLTLPKHFAESFELPVVATRTFAEHSPSLQKAFLESGYKKKGIFYELELNP